MYLVDVLEKYKSDLEEKISCIYYELNENSSLSNDYLIQLGKYNRRIDMIDKILNVFKGNQYKRK